MSTVKNVELGQAGSIRPKKSEAGLWLPTLGISLALLHLPVLAVLVGAGAPSDLVGPAYVLSPAIAIALCWSKLSAAFAAPAAKTRAPLLPLLILIVAAGTVSGLVNQNDLRRSDTFAMWQQLLMAISLFALVPLCRDLSTFRNMLKPILTGWALVGLIALVTLVLHVTGLYRGEASHNRLFGIIGDSVAWILSAFIVIYFERKNWLHFIAAVFFLALTGSRAPAVLAGLGLVVSTLTRSNATIGDTLNKLIRSIAIGIFLVSAPFLMPNLSSRLLQTNIASNDRMPTIIFSLQRYMETPIFGAGYNAQSFYMKQMNFRHGQEGLFGQQPSTWIQMLTDFGLVGFFAFAVFSVLLLRICIRVARSRPTGIAVGAPMQFYLTSRAFACWLIPFILLNHSAPYMVPGSVIGLMYFGGAGMVAGLHQQLDWRRLSSKRPDSKRSRPLRFSRSRHLGPI